MGVYLLEYVSAFGTPSKDFVAAFYAIDGGLTSYCPSSRLIKSNEMFLDSNCFRLKWIFRPWNRR